MDDVTNKAVTAQYDSFSYNELVSTMLEFQAAHNEAKAQAAEAWADVCLITRTVIPTRMDRDQIQNITVILPDGTKKQLLCLDQVSVKTPPEKKGDLWNWLRKHDAAELITETVNSSTLAAYVRQQMVAGDEYPNDICEVSTYTTASLRKAS